MENKETEFDFFDPVYSEFQPLSDEIKNEIQKLFKPEKKEDTGICAAIIRRMMPFCGQQ